MKKLLCLFIILSLALLLFTISHAQDTDIETLKLADVNADGTINILDLVFVAQYFGEIFTEKQDPNPDVNSDGTVNILDLVFAAQYFGQSYPIDREPPRITETTVSDGEMDVDPEMINAAGKIEITFSEEVTGHITLKTEDGDDTGWLGIIEGNTATLEKIAGGEILGETTYVISGTVEDSVGHTLAFNIYFTTARGGPIETLLITGILTMGRIIKSEMLLEFTMARFPVDSERDGISVRSGIHSNLMMRRRMLSLKTIRQLTCRKT